MNLKNLTPHEINIITPAGTITIKAETPAVRVSQKVDFINSIDFNGKEIKLYKKSFQENINFDFNKIEEDTLYIVSSLVYDYIKNNYPDKIKYFVVPGEPIRNSDGNIIGCDGLNIL